jgi:hypothetical protein
MDSNETDVNYNTATRWLADRMGAMVTMEGQEWMLVGLTGPWAVFENEDERTTKVSVLRARALILSGAKGA